VRKRLVTEQQTITVPVTREEITIEHVEGPPGPDAGGWSAGEPLREQVLEVVRYEERVLVTTEVVPVERVRVVRHIVTTPQIVEGDVRREVVEVESDLPPAPGR
jgi:stress response protein YsnF